MKLKATQQPSGETTAHFCRRPRSAVKAFQHPDAPVGGQLYRDVVSL